MSAQRSSGYQRINITLPADTVRLLDRLARKGNRSRFINEAVRFYAENRARSRLKAQVKEGALRRADRDQRLAEEWFPLEEEAWPEKRP